MTIMATSIKRSQARTITLNVPNPAAGHQQPTLPLETPEHSQTSLVEVKEFQLGYFKSWKMMWWKCCTQYTSKFRNLCSGHRTGKDQFSFQSQRRAMPKNVQTIAQLYSSHMLAKECSKILQARVQQHMNHEIPDVQAGFRKGRGTRDQIANIPWIIKKAREFQNKIYFCFIDYAKAFDCMDYNNTWPASWETCMQVRKQQLELDRNNRLVPNMERCTSKLYIVTLLI